MADPRADMAALRGIGVAPPERSKTAPTTAPPPTAAPPEPPPAPSRRSPGTKRASSRSTAAPRPDRAAPPVEPTAGEDRRSRHTTVYLEGPARARLDERLKADPEATVADVMLDAVRAGYARLRQERPGQPAPAPDDPIPAPPRRRRRRRVEDGRAVPVRFSPGEREALDRVGGELDLSISGLISTALTLAPESTRARSPRKT